MPAAFVINGFQARVLGLRDPLYSILENVTLAWIAEVVNACQVMCNDLHNTDGKQRKKLIYEIKIETFRGLLVVVS